jgi:hypothetical protein
MYRVPPAVTGAAEMDSAVAAIRGEQEVDSKTRPTPTTTAALDLRARIWW